jgi:quercetin dioxygenase-like cupin family protein
MRCRYNPGVKVFRGGDAPLKQADPNTFVGDASMKRLAASEDGTPVHVYHVEFADGARTNWHIHSGAQWLMIVEGSIRIQTQGERAIDTVAGDAIVIAPGEKHWHGARPGGRGVHIAINVDATTEWLEPVSDTQYRSVMT